MNSLQIVPDLSEFHFTLANSGGRGDGIGPYQLLPRACLPPAHLGCPIDWWLAGFNRTWKAIASRGSPSELWHAGNDGSLDESPAATALLATSRRMPPPKSTTDIQATEADDDGWEPRCWTSTSARTK